MKKFLVFISAVAILTPSLVFSSSLININTADATLLETLPGIGAFKAQAIIDYRNTNGPFTTIADIQNVSGIGSATYAKLEPLITVGTPQKVTPDPTATSTASASTTVTVSTTEVVSSGGGTPQYVPIPVLRLVVNGSRSVEAGADTTFTAVVYDEKARKRSDALVAWSFGDGMSRTSASVLHAFYEPGAYNVVVEATTDDGGFVSSSFVVTAKKSGVEITSISPQNITLTNKSENEVDLSNWRLIAGVSEFKFPLRTKILPKHSVAFSSRVTNLLPVGSAILRYPNGDVAAVYPSGEEKISMQPPSAPVSYNSMQRVEPEQKITIEPTHDVEAVVAPTASTTVAAVGVAVLSPPARLSPLASPWLYAFVGTLIFSALAFVFLRPKVE